MNQDRHQRSTPNRDLGGIDGEPVDLRQLTATVWSGKWFIVGVTALITLVALAWATLSTPVYRADALVRIEPNRAAQLEISTIGGGMRRPLSLLADAEIAVIRSRSVLGEVVDSAGLTVEATPEHLPVIGSWIARHARRSGGEPASPLPGLSQYGWGGNQVAFARLTVPRALLGKRLTLVAGSAGKYKLLMPGGKLLLKGVAGKPARSSRTGPEGQPIATALVSKLVSRSGVQFAVTKVRRLTAIERLQRRLHVHQVGMQGSGVVRVSLDGGKPSATAREINRLVEVFVRKEARYKASQAKNELHHLWHQLPSARKDFHSAMNAWASRPEQARTGRLRLHAQHLLPLVTNVDERVERLRILAKVTPRPPWLKTLPEAQVRLGALKRKLDETIGKLPPSQKDVLDAERAVLVKAKVYVALLNDARRLWRAERDKAKGIQVIDRAMVPVQPVRPKKGLTAALSLLIGLLVGAGIVLGREMLAS